MENQGKNMSVLGTEWSFIFLIYIQERKLMRKFSKPMLLSRLYFILPSERELLGIRIKS